MATATLSAPPPTLHTIWMGETAVACAPDQVRTILGSCIGLVVYDPRAKIGGMAHVVLPESHGDAASPGKFADTAVPFLIEQLLQHGAGRPRLAAKLTGGASMFQESSVTAVGAKNQQAVWAALKSQGIRVAGTHLGGIKGRRVIFDIASGEVRVEVAGGEAVVL